MRLTPPARKDNEAVNTLTRYLICGPAPCSEAIRDAVKTKLKILALQDIQEWARRHGQIPNLDPKIEYQELSKDPTVEEWHIGVIF